MSRGLVLLAIACVGCAPSRATGPSDQAPPGSVVIKKETMAIRQGPIGVRETQDATYVLVDVENKSDVDRIIAIEGALTDAEGRDISPLSLDEMHVPTGEKRTFALVGNQVLPQAVDARLNIRRAARAEHPPPLRVTEQRAEQDEDHLAVTGRIRNTLERPALATIVATFYDKDGKILARPFRFLEFAPEQSRPIRFDGPRKAALARLFVGGEAY
ncbi:MAG: hypothetical protein HY698_08530 [Deltaproteobacteria bacterium]|nr:hypothetical protein [Deltaproteobacteria bacterium]